MTLLWHYEVIVKTTDKKNNNYEDSLILNSYTYKHGGL